MTESDCESISHARLHYVVCHYAALFVGSGLAVAGGEFRRQEFHMGEVVYGVDFRAKREAEIERMALEIMSVALLPSPHDDTAPCEYVAPENDSA